MRGIWVVDEVGEGEKGSTEVARWRFARRELRNAAGPFSCAVYVLVGYTGCN